MEVFFLRHFCFAKSFTRFTRFIRFTLGKTGKTQIPRVINMPAHRLYFNSLFDFICQWYSQFKVAFDLLNDKNSDCNFTNCYIFLTTSKSTESNLTLWIKTSFFLFMSIWKHFQLTSSVQSSFLLMKIWIS